MSHEYVKCEGCFKPFKEHLMAHTSSGSFCDSCYRMNKKKIDAAQAKADAAINGGKTIEFFKNTILASVDTVNCSAYDKPRSFDWCEKNCPKYSSCDTIAWAEDELKLYEGSAWHCSSCGSIVNNDEDCSCGKARPTKAKESSSTGRERDFPFDSPENQERNVVLAFICDSNGKRTGLRVLMRADNTIKDMAIPASMKFWNVNINPGFDKPGHMIPKCCNLGDFPVLKPDSNAIGTPLKASNAGAWVLGEYPDGRLRLVSVSGQLKDVTHETAAGFHVKYKIANAELSTSSKLVGKTAAFPVIGSEHTVSDLFYANPETGIIVWERPNKKDLCFYPFDAIETALDNKKAKDFFTFLEFNLSGKVERPKSTALLAEGLSQASMDKIVSFAKKHQNNEKGMPAVKSGLKPAPDRFVFDANGIVEWIYFKPYSNHNSGNYVVNKFDYSAIRNVAEELSVKSFFEKLESLSTQRVYTHADGEDFESIISWYERGKFDCVGLTNETRLSLLSLLKSGDDSGVNPSVVECKDCGEEIDPDAYSTYYIESEKAYFCTHCRDNFTTCAACGGLFRNAGDAKNCPSCKNHRDDSLDDVFSLQSDGRVEWMYFNHDGYGGEGQYVSNIFYHNDIQTALVSLKESGNTGNAEAFFDFIGSFAKQYLVDNDGSKNFKEEERRYAETQWDLMGCTEVTMNALISFVEEVVARERESSRNDVFHVRKDADITRMQFEWSYMAENNDIITNCLYSEHILEAARYTEGGPVEGFFDYLNTLAKKDNRAHQLLIKSGDSEYGEAMRNLHSDIVAAKGRTEQTKLILINAASGIETKSLDTPTNNDKPFHDEEKGVNETSRPIEYEIYQINDKLDEAAIKLMFTPYKELLTIGESVERKNYRSVYQGVLDSTDSNECLHEIFYIFNANHPADYKGRSVSVSDVIVLTDGGVKTAYYVDSIDYKVIEGFIDSKEQSGNAKQTVSGKSPSGNSNQGDIDAMKALNAELIEACNAYYNNDDSPLSDYEYDKKFDELREMEAKTGIILSDSVIQGVGATVVGKLPKVQHTERLLSLEKTKDVGDLVALMKHSGADDCGVLAWKLDGLTIVVTYKNGTLQRAVTRGNGKVGEDVTHSAKFFKGLPRRIPYNGEIQFRGEAVVSFATFNKINDSLPADTEPYKNSRNLASGTVRRLKATKDGSVEFIAFSLISKDGNIQHKSYSEELNFIRAQGVTTVQHYLCDSTNVSEFVEKFKEMVKSYDKPTDGLVFTLDDTALHESLGATGHHPKWAKAFKWADDRQKTILRKIFWSASRTGVLTPVAIFDPVELEGTTVSRASVSNLTILRKLELGIGDEISVYKANMIIPQIAENHTKSNTAQYPAECPVCGGATAIRKDQSKDDSSEFVVCLNEDCVAKNIGTLTHFVKREAMNIDGIGEKSITELVAEGFLKKPVDFYTNISKHPEIANLPGWGKASYNKLVYAIDNSREARLEQVLYSLGIKNVGRTASEAIATHFKSMAAVINAATDSRPGVAGNLLGQVEGVGELMASAIIDYFSKNLGEVEALIAELNIQNPGSQSAIKAPSGVPQGAPNCLSGLSFCITGKVDFPGKRTGLQQYISSLGGKHTSSVSRGVDYLITNDPNSGSKKNKDAQTLGCKVISESSFMRLIQEKSAGASATLSKAVAGASVQTAILYDEYKAGDYSLLTDEETEAERTYNKEHEWGFTEESLTDIVKAHLDAGEKNDYRTMLRLEYRLDDANFRTEAAYLHDGDYERAFAAAARLIGEEFTSDTSPTSDTVDGFTNFKKQIDSVVIPDDERDARIQMAEAVQTLTGMTLAGLKICVTGKLDYGDRGSFHQFIRSLGGEPASSVTRGVDYLVTNTPNSGTNKNKAALDNGCRVILESEFMKLARGQTDFKFMSTTSTQTENKVERDPYFSQIPEEPKAASSSQSNMVSGIAGKTFCITGRVNFPGKRAGLQEFINRNGGFNSDKVGYGVDYLITNDPTSGSTKNRAAKSLGCRVISEAEFMRMANSRHEI